MKYFLIFLILVPNLLYSQIFVNYDEAQLQVYTISGYLKYDNDPSVNLPIPGATIYIKDGPEPHIPAVTPVPTILYSTITDINGFYSINVPNGIYYLYASSNLPWISITDADVTQIRNFIAWRTNSLATCSNVSGICVVPHEWLTMDTLRIRASDINADGAVDNGDVIPLRRKIIGATPNPQYLLPDWLFDNPMVIINNTNRVNLDQHGILSGEVNGTWPTP